MAPEIRRIPVKTGLVENRHYAPAVVVFARPFGVNVTPHAPAVAGGIAPLLDVGVAPGAEGELDCAVLGEQGVAHCVVAESGFGGAVVVVWWGGGWGGVAFGVVLVGVCPVLGDGAVVVFEIWIGC